MKTSVHIIPILWTASSWCLWYGMYPFDVTTAADAAVCGLSDGTTGNCINQHRCFYGAARGKRRKRQWNKTSIEPVIDTFISHTRRDCPNEDDVCCRSNDILNKNKTDTNETGCATDADGKSRQFTCSNGFCIAAERMCDGVIDCFDRSDEPPLQTSCQTPTTKSSASMCVLPPYPAHGTYTVSAGTGATPGQSLSHAFLTVQCQSGYKLSGSRATAFCSEGLWTDSMPTCVRETVGGHCILNSHPSVEHLCFNGGSGGGTRACARNEPSGAVVVPRCSQHYYYFTVLPAMRCVQGQWNYVAACLPDCGKVTPSGERLVVDGVEAQYGELPWHVGVYRKEGGQHRQICGGTIISTNVVISAAHCFWSDVDKKLSPASTFAIGAGKLYRDWNSPNDNEAQKSDVADIKVPERYRGRDTNYQEDIALVVLATTLVYRNNVRAICLDFEPIFGSRQLTNGSLGKVSGWGLQAEDGVEAATLLTVELPVVDVGSCFELSPYDFRQYFTRDKFCAGYYDGRARALCKGDSGGGLAFPDYGRAHQRYYLRGVASLAPRNQHLCNARAPMLFTDVLEHELFIKQHI